LKKYLVICLLYCCFAFANTTTAQSDQPVANDSAIVIAGNARFTILTPQLIRMEWSSDSHFIDDASQVFINRRLPVPIFFQKIKDGVLTITTSSLRVVYNITTDSFTSGNLSIYSLSNSPSFSWHPGLHDSLNLKGTMRTLDGVNGGSISMLEDGIISKGGWTLVNDTKSYLFDGDTTWNWVKDRPRKAYQDWYFFGYGHQYRQALNDFTKVAGNIPLPPRFAFGYWWSRYWIYSDREMEDLVSTFRSFAIPIDVMIVDMDWHNTYKFRGNATIDDGQGSLVGWTGYTWNKNLFPHPDSFFEWMDKHGIKNALNLHPSSGIPPMEEKYSSFAKAYHFDTSGKKYIPYYGSDKNWATIYFDTIIHPLEKEGVDFWWLDWQQYPYDRLKTHLSNTWWLNYMFFTNMEEEGKRPLLFHRWGGLGNHRYQIGFSGDTYITWQTLAFEPAFTATAANVGYGYWSHDIGGHQYGNTVTPEVKNKELFLRWMQFGVFSPILRTHSTKRAEIDRRPWMYGEEFLPLKQLIQLRYQLNPYIYTSSWETYQTGASLCHPLYYVSPEKEEAYQNNQEYYFGDDIIVAPIATPIDSNNFLAKQKIWLPDGQWEEWFTGSTLQGGTYERSFTKYDIPVYVRSGSIIPMYPDNTQSLQKQIDTIVLMVFRGNGKNILYEDDGCTDGYKHGQYTTTLVEQQTKESGSTRNITITIHPKEGSYSGMSNSKTYIIKFYRDYIPNFITVNGQPIDYNTSAFADTYSYDAQTLETIVRLPQTSDQNKIVVTATYIILPDELLDGVPGFFNRTKIAMEKLKYQVSEVDWGAALPDELLKIENTPDFIQYNPSQTYNYLLQLKKEKKDMSNIIMNIPDVKKTELQKLCDFLEIK